MRILTSSKTNPIGFISVLEADDNAPQNVTFCIPIEKYNAEYIKNLDDFSDNFKDGITTKIRVENKVETLRLKFENGNFDLNWDEPESFPKFSVTVLGNKVEFYLSRANFDLEKKFELNIDRIYTGNILESLENKKLILLEPNWKQLDKLFLETKSLFIDWQ